MALSQGIRARLEVQRALLKEKLDQLGSQDPPSALNPDPEASPLLSVAGSAHVSKGRFGERVGGLGVLFVSVATCLIIFGHIFMCFDSVLRSEVKCQTRLVLILLMYLLLSLMETNIHHCWELKLPQTSRKRATFLCIKYFFSVYNSHLTCARFLFLSFIILLCTFFIRAQTLLHLCWTGS